MTSELILAVPSKGRLQENCQAFFARAGLPLVQGRGARDYSGRMAGLPAVEIAYLSASEIARELSAGNVHLGVTGEDLIREAIPDADSRIAFVTPLGFGHANVVVAVPTAWIDVGDMADLDDVASAFRARHGRRFRVATKYIETTRRFFAEKGVTDYRIVESLGATEGAPAAGAAEAIVDITTTGATLAANGLKVLSDGVILRSQANLVGALRAAWTAPARAALATMLDRIAAESTARTTREVRFEGVAARGGAGTLRVPEAEAFATVEALRAEGATRVVVARVEEVFERDNPLWRGIEGRLPAG
jgi:ATP phosphoribosyltransferase